MANTLGRKIQVRQGLRANLPILDVGEFGLATDDSTLWIGTTSGNMEVGSGVSGGGEVADGSIDFDKLSPELQERLEDLVVIDNLNSTSSTNPVSANQARLLNENISNHKTKRAELNELGHVYHGVVNATITSTWLGTNAPFIQEVVVNGITENDSPFITVNYSDDLTRAIAQRDAYNLIDSAITENNKIIFKCFDEAPLEPLSIQVKVVR